MLSRTTIAFTLALCASLIGANAGQPVSPSSKDNRAFTGGRVAVSIGDVAMLPVLGVQGGDPRLTLPSASERDRGGMRAQVTHEPLELTLNLGQALGSAEASAWLSRVVGGSQSAADGVVTVMNFEYEAVRELLFKGAQPTRFALGTLDGSSKERADFTVTLQPASSSWNLKPAAGKLDSKFSAKQKAVNAANFKVTMAGLPTKRIAKVEGIGATYANGAWTPDRLHLFVSATDMPEYIMNLQEAIDGKPGAGKPATLTVELLDPTLKNTLATFTAEGARIVRASMDMGHASAEAIAQGDVEIVVERWTLK